MYSQNKVDPQIIYKLLLGCEEDIDLAEELLKGNRMPWYLWRDLRSKENCGIVESTTPYLKPKYRIYMNHRGNIVALDHHHSEDIQKGKRASKSRFWNRYYTFIDKIKHYVFKLKKIRLKRS